MALPPAGPPLLAIETTTTTVPMSHDQNPVATSRGKANERAPTCKGTTATAMPRTMGAMAAITRPTRYVDKTCGSEPGSSNARLVSARSTPSRTPTTATAARNIIPLNR